MSDQYMSEIRLMSFNYPPRGWALCNGQLLPIAQNQALFSLLGTVYGGDGIRNFGLPDLRGRIPIGTQGQYVAGQVGGAATNTLLLNEMPMHTHLAQGTTTAADETGAPGNFFGATTSPASFYGPAATLTPVVGTTIAQAGQSQPHENLQPYLTLAFCIALVGIFPSRN